MVSIPVYNMAGSKVGDYEIDPASIAPKITKQLLHEAVVMYLANDRQGSNKTKTPRRSLRSTKKMYKQKGTGNARAVLSVRRFAVVVVTQMRVSRDRTTIDCLARRFRLRLEWRLRRSCKAVAWFCLTA